MLSDKELSYFAGEYGTPVFVFDTKALKERIQAIRELFGEKITLCYSIKANPFLIPAMLESVSKLEVCSPGELSICERLQVPMDRIVYSGVNKMPADISQAMSDEVGIFTAESRGQLELVNAEAERQGKVVPVLLRLNGGSQFGMSREDLLRIYEERAKFSGVSLEGIHFFVGTQRKKLKEQRAELQMLRELFDEIGDRFGERPKKLEYGPGLPVPLFEKDDFSDTLAPAREIADALQEAASWAELTVEMGRFFVTECGYYLTKICDQKAANGNTYALTDGGMNHVNYLGQIMGMKVPVIRHLTGEGRSCPAEFAGKEITWSLCGSLCTTADVMVRKIAFTDLQCGDVLAFSNIGAYSVTEGIHLFLSRTMPRIVLRNDYCSGQLVRDFYESSLLNTPGWNI
ncbi:MAG: alanine racemase [Lachnospiraceae bacterium]|nr:alanine racemase [Lachnospiraceae bacterium]